MDLKQAEVQKAIEATNGRIFFAAFEKKNGKIRRMTARVGVSKGVTGAGMHYIPERRGLKVVYDMDKRDYRMINLAGVLEIKCAEVERSWRV